MDVSRETYADLAAFAELVRKWNPKINLVAKSTLADLEERHIADSAQLWPLLSHTPRVVDLGSGGGFPGLVLAIHAKHVSTTKTVSLVEADQRKSAFLRTVIRELDLPATVLTERIENLSPQDAPTITARALTALPQLCAFAYKHLATDGTLYALKGALADQEVEDARRYWRFSLQKHASRTSSDAVILEIGALARV